MTTLAIFELNEITLREMLETYRRNMPSHAANDVSVNCLGRLEIITPKETLCEEDFSSELICAFFAYLVITKRKFHLYMRLSIRFGKTAHRETRICK